MKKFLIYLGIILLVAILGYLAACYFGPKNMNVEETLKIDAPAPIVFNLVNDIKKMEEWNDWNLQDTGMVVTYSGPSQGVGATGTWTNSKYGDGSQEIIESVENEKLKTKLSFEGWDGDNFGIFHFVPNGLNATDVTWSFEGSDIPFLFRAMMFNGKSQMSTSYQEGLNNLAKIAKQRVAHQYNGYTIKQIDMPERHFVINRQEVKVANMQQFYATNLGQLFGKVQAGGVEMDGMPCGLFFRMDQRDGMVDMAAAIPIKQAVSISGADSYAIDAKRGLQIDYLGDYQGVSAAHTAMSEYLRDRGYLQDHPVIEEYVTDPGTEPDPSKWLTRVSYYYSE